MTQAVSRCLPGVNWQPMRSAPPKAIRDLRDYTRARTRLIHERSRCWQRLEKLLEGALIKLSSVASKLTTLSAQDMIKAMIAGQRDPEVLAGLARRTMKAKHDALVQALDGMFDDHHGELAALLPARSPPWTPRSTSWEPGPPS
jgi:transposase